MNDEDWSIISSSSDMDEEQTPGSSREVISDAEAQRNREMSFSSVGTLKVPVMETPQRSNNGEKDESASGKNDLPKQVSIKVDEEPDAEGYRVKKAVYFYESLSSLNDSIKQKSTDFYESVARFRLQQLQRYMSPIEISPDRVSESTKNDGEDADSICTDSTDDSSVSSQSETETRQVVEPPQSFGRCVAMEVSSMVDKFSNTIENNSEYLLYYFLMVVLGSISVVYIRYSQIAVTPVVEEPKPLYEDYLKHTKHLVENLLYDQTQEPRPGYLGLWKQPSNQKQLKISKYWRHVEENLYDAVITKFNPYVTELKNAINERVPRDTYNKLFSSIIGVRHYLQSNLPRHISNAHSAIIIGRRNAIDSYHNIAIITRRQISSEWEGIKSFYNSHYIRSRLNVAKAHIDNTAIFVYRKSSPLRNFVTNFTNYSFQSF